MNIKDYPFSIELNRLRPFITVDLDDPETKAVFERGFSSEWQSIVTVSVFKNCVRSHVHFGILLTPAGTIKATMEVANEGVEVKRDAVMRPWYDQSPKLIAAEKSRDVRVKAQLLLDKYDQDLVPEDVLDFLKYLVK